MPFMIGKAPVRRTLDYLKNCKIIFRENVRIFTISYNLTSKHHLGAREFVFWHLSQVQYNNPTVQCVKLKNITPTPFIKVYFEDREPLLIDLDSRTRTEIMGHLENLNLITKTKEEQEYFDKISRKTENPSYFGYGCKRYCICDTYGQIPCPSLVPVPKHWRGIQKGKKLLIPPCFEKWAQEVAIQDK